MSNKIIHTPEGFRDVYGNELENKIKVMEKLHNTFQLYGFREIQTPAMEFSEVYLPDIGTTSEKEMYRFFDKEGNMLVLRPDFTPSVARCASKYYVDDSMPIRLMYQGKVFNNTHELQGKLKETTQMGAELIESEASYVSDGEMICMVIESLLEIGFKDFQICIGNMGYFKGICDAAGFKDDFVEDLRSYISSKNYFGANEFLESAGIKKHIISGILDVSGFTDFSDLDKAKLYVDNERSTQALNYLQNIYDFVKEYGYEKYISLDLCMLSKFHYYTGILFKAYTYGTGDAIVKGGRYDNLLAKFGKPSNAVGFVFMIDDILSALNQCNLIKNQHEDIIWVVYSIKNKSKAFENIKEYRNKGKACAAILFDEKKAKQDYLDYAEKNHIKTVKFVL